MVDGAKDVRQGGKDVMEPSLFSELCQHFKDKYRPTRFLKPSRSDGCSGVFG